MPLDPYETIAEVAAADCNINVAAEILSKRIGRTVRPAEVLQTIAADQTIQDQLIRQLKVKVTLSAYAALDLVGTVITGALADYAPADHVRAYSAFATLFSTLSQQNSINILPGNINIMDKVLAMMPPDAREAVRMLSTTPNDNDTDPTPMHNPGRKGRPRKLPTPTLIGNEQ